MNLVRRTALLAATSVIGIALLAPLAARSAAPMAVSTPDRLLAPDASATLVDRGRLVGRQAETADTEGVGSIEQFADARLPTPAAAPMQATLHTIATPAPSPVAVSTRTVSYSGDSVWDDLARCESSGNWAINTGNGYYGGLQFSHPTWHGYDGGEFAEYPHQATRDEQIIVAERLRAARGYQPWPACRIKLGLP